MEASKSKLQTSKILATLPAVQGQLPASLPPEVLAKLPAPQSQVPQSITPEMVASLAAMQQQQQPGDQPCNAGGGGGGLPADIPQLPNMPDISFPPMPSGPKMPQLPHNMSLFRAPSLHKAMEEDDDCTLLRYLIAEDRPNYELLDDDAEERPDFSGLADISFPPIPSGPKMPQLPHMSLFRTPFLYMVAEEDYDCTLLRYLIAEDRPNYELLHDDAEEMAMWLALQKEDL